MTTIVWSRVQRLNFPRPLWKMRQTTSRRLKIQFVYQNLVLAEVLQRWAKHDWSLPTLYFRSILWYLWRGWFDWCCRQGSQFNATATPHKDAHKHIVRYTHSKRHMYVAYIYIYLYLRKKWISECRAYPLPPRITTAKVLPSVLQIRLSSRMQQVIWPQYSVVLDVFGTL